VSTLPPLPREDLDHARAVVGERWQGLKGQHIFLTGGTGFVGKWLLATLLDANRQLALGCRVTVLSRNTAAFSAQVPDLADSDAVELVQGDVRRIELPGRRFDRVVHAATDVAVAGQDLETFDTCVAGTRRVLDLALHTGARSVLLVSSGAVYGRQPPELPAMGEDFAGSAEPLQTTSAYTMGKRAAEWLAHRHGRQHGLNILTARCFAFVGPYLPLDAHFAIGNFLRDALAGRPITIQGDGTPLRSYLHAADMAAWSWALLAGGAPHSVYNIGGTEAVSIQQLAQHVVAATGSSSPITVLKQAVAGAPAERYVPDVSRIRRDLQLPPALALDEALRRTVDWLRVARR
jgi:nucleoside-diphosphate-sugar epimerase